MRRQTLIDKVFLGFAAGFLVVIGVASYLDYISRWLGVSYGAASVLTLAVYGWDKYRAQKEQWRVSEVTLHFLELIGGWPGALIAQRLFRHKNRKVTFQIAFWLIVFAHLAIWGWVASKRLTFRT